MLVPGSTVYNPRDVLDSGDVYRLVTLYSTLSERGYLDWCLIFARDSISCRPANIELVDKFMIYNENAQKVSQDKVQASIAIKRFRDGVEPYVNYVPVILLEEGSDVVTSAKYFDYRPLKTASFIDRLGFVSIIDLINYYKEKYYTRGRPLFKELDGQKLLQALSKAKLGPGLEVDNLIETVFSLTNINPAYAHTVHIVLVDSLGSNAIMIDAKRLLSIPDKFNIRRVRVIQSAPTTLIVLEYNSQDINKLRNNIVIISRDLYTKYIKGGSLQLRIAIESKMGKKYYGGFILPEEEHEEASDFLFS